MIKRSILALNVLFTAFFLAMPVVLRAVQIDPETTFGRRLEITGINATGLPEITITANVFDSIGQPVRGLDDSAFELIGDLATRGTMNIMSMIGVLLLMGIVAKNAILLIDFAKWSEEAGMDRREALIEAGRVRLRPILMTTFALIAGMIPVALGSGEGGDFRAPLGVAVIGGTLTATLLTLLVIPTVYEILADSRDWLGAKFSRSKATAGAAHGHAPAEG